MGLSLSSVWLLRPPPTPCFSWRRSLSTEYQGRCLRTVHSPWDRDEVTTWRPPLTPPMVQLQLVVSRSRSTAALARENMTSPPGDTTTPSQLTSLSTTKVGRVKIQVYRGPSKGEGYDVFAPWGYYNTQPADLAIHH